MSASVRLSAALVAPLTTGAVLFLAASPVVAAPYADDASLSADSTNPDVGDELTLSGRNYEANERVALDLHSQVVRLATVRADGDGAFTATVRLPANFECEHFITATGLSSDRRARTDIVIGDCDDDASGGENDDEGTGLPATGAAVGGLALAGGLLTAGGVVLVRRRRD